MILILILFSLNFTEMSTKSFTPWCYTLNSAVSCPYGFTRSARATTAQQMGNLPPPLLSVQSPHTTPPFSCLSPPLCRCSHQHPGSCSGSCKPSTSTHVLGFVFLFWFVCLFLCLFVLNEAVLVTTVVEQYTVYENRTVAQKVFLFYETNKTPYSD